ncbi:hypothetical protein AB1Y20_009930 [Prymnesium parvum]|uniref:Post-GPI attachment to proteins factor 3 n=1 Tax=Prymnesium parvum TaxID=97485 RepID=A0AB34K3I8_PRYPA
MALVLPPHLSRRILCVSFLSVASVASAAYNECKGSVVCATLVLLTSINYWRHPVFGWRRNLDIAVCAGSLSYQLGLAATAAPPTARDAYFAMVAAALSCYGCSRYFSFARGDKELASRFHCALHCLGNLGNVLLYDSLHTNWMGWKDE